MSSGTVMNQKAWNEILDELIPSVHPVDQNATRIWFGFWPLELREALTDPEGIEEMARVMDLEGNWSLEEQMDASVEFLYGAKHWIEVKRAVLANAEVTETTGGPETQERLREVAKQVAARAGDDVSVLLGITAVAFMILQQVGKEALSRVADRPATRVYDGSPESVVARRERPSRGALHRWLTGHGEKHRVVWDEQRKKGHFDARHGQDLAMAAATDETSYREMDYRRIDGPIPVECRVASCGYCWVGILRGRERLSEISDFERERLRYFGYDATNRDDDPHPLIRLACQASCYGDVTLVIPPWNGELKRRHHKTPGVLGTA